MNKVRIAFLALLTAALAPDAAFSRSCSGLWQTGGVAKITFLKSESIRYCDAGKCQSRKYRLSFRRDVVVFRLADSQTSVVVSWIDGKYLMSKKAGRTARTVYAPLTCRN
jgi:hypothetical protein